jgi:hypothetical protein
MRQKNLFSRRRGGGGESPGGDIRREFDTYSAFVERAVNGDSVLASDRRSSRESDASSSWDYGAGWDGAVKLAELGWPDGLERLERAQAEILGGGTLTVRHEVHYDVAGDEPDVGRFVSGEPENMLTFDTVITAGPGPIVSLVVNLSCSAVISARSYFARGAAVMVLIDALEDAGRRVELSVVASGRSGLSGGTDTIRVLIKQADQPLDRDRLAFVVCHPAFFRRLCFSVWEQSSIERIEQFGFRTAGGYGMPVRYMDQSEDAIYSPGIYSGSDWLPDRARAWVLDHLKRQGVEVETV